MGGGKERRQTLPIVKCQFIKIKGEIFCYDEVFNFDWAGLLEWPKVGRLIVGLQYFDSGTFIVSLSGRK